MQYMAMRLKSEQPDKDSSDVYMKIFTEEKEKWMTAMREVFQKWNTKGRFGGDVSDQTKLQGTFRNIQKIYLRLYCLKNFRTQGCRPRKWPWLSNVTSDKCQIWFASKRSVLGHITCCVSVAVV